MRAQPLELGGLGRPGDAGAGRHRDIASGAAPEPPIDDSGDQASSSSIEAFLGRFGGDNREAVHFEELHQRPADRHVVFDHEHEARAINGHEAVKYSASGVDDVHDPRSRMAVSHQRAPSSVVEHVTFNHGVLGSIPRGPTNEIGGFL